MSRARHHTPASWTPLWLRSDLGAWLDPEYGITKNEGTGRVSQWVDRTGNLTMVQAIGGNQFLWQAAASEMNGRQSLYGDGSRYMSATSISAALRVTQQAHSLIVISRASGDQLGTGATSSGNILLMRYLSKVRGHVWAAGATTSKDGDTTIASTTRHVVGQVATGAPGSGTLYPLMDGALDAAGTAIGGTAVSPSTSFIIGARGFGVGGDTFNGYLGDVLLVKRAFTAPEIKSLFVWAKTRWSL